MQALKSGEVKFVRSVGLISLLTIFLYLSRSVLSGGLKVYSYVLLNLVLAWLPLIFAWMLSQELKIRRWLSWQNLALSALWLTFLPNAWYVLTDFIHISPYGQVSRIYDILMFSALGLCGLALGFASLYIVHKELIKRFEQAWALVLVAVVIFVGSFAIYLGRELRWNTWDIVKDPSGLVLTVSDRVVSPLEYPGTLSITLLFFIFLSVLYLSIWQMFGSKPKAKR